MIRLLIIADDITGALDTGVHFSKVGIKTRVVLSIGTDAPACDVLVVNAETRHLSPSEAYRKVFEIVAWALKKGAVFLFKKTDSALRGNIGAELAALRDASGQPTLPFLPAFPQMNRTTIKGIHYINGVPVSDSVFGCDPFEPVSSSSVCDIIRLQTETPVKSFSTVTAETDLSSEQGILVFDGQSTDDLERTGRIILQQKDQRIFAGCAGFAATLPKLLELPSASVINHEKLPNQFLVICGSVNPITCEQLNIAENYGFARLILTVDQKLNPDRWNTDQGRAELNRIVQRLKNEKLAILDSNDCCGGVSTRQFAEASGYTIEDVRQKISRSIGGVVGELMDCKFRGTLLITGGDTFLQALIKLGISELEPICELSPGVVISRISYRAESRYVISKSGGFGTPDLLVNLAKQLNQEVL